MKQTLKIILIVICVIILPIVVYNTYAYRTSLRYVDAPIFVYNQEKDVARYMPSPKALILSLIGDEEYFNGYVNLKFVGFDGNKVEIKMGNNSTGDDSIGITEDDIIAEKKEQGWMIVQHKTHWKCARDLFFSFWTTKACI